jgi:putative FmdB family regulatory protein
VPTYQYACTTCGEQTEAVQRFTDDPLTVCPACGGTLRKVFSPVGIVFKGSGFYRTDSRKASVPSGEKTGEKTAAKSNGSGDSSSGDSKKTSSDSGSSSSDSKSANGKSSDNSKPAAKKPAGAGSSA